MLSNIAFIAKAKHGKTSASIYLQYRHGYRRYAFANALKKEFLELYDALPREVYVEKPAHIRKGLQELGMRKRGLDPGYWIKKLAKQINDDKANFIERTRQFYKKEFISNYLSWPIVIDDLRFMNEAEWARQQGFIIVKLVRKGEFVESGMTKETKAHISEHEWEQIKPHVVIEHTSFEELFKGINMLLANIKYAYETAHTKQLNSQEEFEKETGQKAIWKGKETKGFLKWLNEQKSDEKSSSLPKDQ